MVCVKSDCVEMCRVRSGYVKVCSKWELWIKPRLLVSGFKVQLWRKDRFFSKAVRQNSEQQAWAQGYRKSLCGSVQGVKSDGVAATGSHCVDVCRV